MMTLLELKILWQKGKKPGFTKSAQNNRKLLVYVPKMSLAQRGALRRPP